jgi:hypothetical protein
VRAPWGVPLLLLAACASGYAGTSPVAAESAAAARPPLVELRELLVASGDSADVAPRVRALAGARVRVRGWLAALEEPLGDGFWLVPRPIIQDESGAGTGDLPPCSVRVRAPAAVVQVLPAEPTPLEATGRLEVGREVDGAGRASLVRLIVEDPREVVALAPP